MRKSERERERERERESRKTKASEAFIITIEISERKASQRRREVYFTFKSVSVFQIFKR